MDPALEKHLRSHHFELGSDGPTYRTVNNNYGAEAGERTQLNNNLSKDLQATHFVLGTESAKKSTSFHQSY